MEEIKITGSRRNLFCGYTGEPDAHTHDWVIAKQGRDHYFLIVDNKRYFEGASVRECLIEVAHLVDDEA